MAAVQLAGGALPITKKVTGVGTTLQRFNLPPRCTRVQVRGSAAILVQFTGADGAVVGADAVPVAANTWQAFNLGPRQDGAAPFLNVAAATGTADVYVSAEVR